MNTSTLFISFFILFLVAKTLIQLYLSWRQLRHVQKNREQVPVRFQDKISLADHQKAADYTCSKLKVGRVFWIIDLLLLLFWTIGGGLALLDRWVLSFSFEHYLFNGLFFFATFSIIGLLIGLPQSLYNTFVLEEKFGFNKTTGRLFILDLGKQLLLSALIGLPLLALILFLMEQAGTGWWLYAWICLSAFQLFLMWVYPVVIAPLFNKFSPLEDGPHKERIVDLLKRCQFSYQGLFVMDASKRSSHGNAYFTGFGKSKRIVFFDTLLKQLSANEAEAVLAHELGHFKHRHILKMILFSLSSSLIGFFLIGYLAKQTWFLQSFGFPYYSSYILLILFSLTLPIFTFFLVPIMAFFSRRHEFAADHFAKKNSNAQDLVNALMKLYKDNASTLTPDPLYSKFYHSHPDAQERISELLKD